MKAACTIHQLAAGRWQARHTSSQLGAVEVTAPTRDQALTKLRDELQYRIELCPCSGVSGDRVELQVQEDARIG
jgi:hypothetical protein